MAESGPQRQVLAARERTGGRGVVVVALVTAATSPARRSGRRWGRLVGW